MVSGTRMIWFSVRSFFVLMPVPASTCPKQKPMKKPEFDLRGEDDLRRENEQIKARLTHVYGMQEYTSCLPARVENEWLKSIEKFEQTVRKERQENLRHGLSPN